MTGMRNDDLINYLENRNNRFKNSAGMELGNSDGKMLWTFFSLSDHDYGPNAFDISTEQDTAEGFIAGFKLNKIEDVDRLGYTNSWMRYLNGDAEISVTTVRIRGNTQLQNQ